MPTLGEAARQLRVSRRTLDKWLKRCEIEPSHHSADFRYWEITDEDVRTIMELRATMPGKHALGVPQIADISPESLRGGSGRLVPPLFSSYVEVPPRQRDATHTRPLPPPRERHYGGVTKSDIARWLADGHGVTFGTYRLLDLPLDKKAAFEFAVEHERRIGFRASRTNQVQHCHRPECECQTVDLA
jgi:hypothetical protein